MFVSIVLLAAFSLAPTLTAALAPKVSDDSPEPRFRRQVIDAKIAIGYGLAIGRVDADEKLDIILADKRQFVWYRGGDWKRFVLAENLTTYDNVCVAARDVDGDGLVEIAVGGQWNPGDTLRSGSVHYLVRPEDPTERWHAMAIPATPRCIACVGCASMVSAITLPCCLFTDVATTTGSVMPLGFHCTSFRRSPWEVAGE